MMTNVEGVENMHRKTQNKCNHYALPYSFFSKFFYSRGAVRKKDPNYERKKKRRVLLMSCMKRNPTNLENLTNFPCARLQAYLTRSARSQKSRRGNMAGFLCSLLQGHWVKLELASSCQKKRQREKKDLMRLYFSIFGCPTKERR